MKKTIKLVLVLVLGITPLLFNTKNISAACDNLFSSNPLNQSTSLDLGEIVTPDCGVGRGGGGTGGGKGSGGSGGISYRTVYGKYTTKIHEGKQGKHIVGHNNYISGRSYIDGGMSTAQRLVSQKAGKGTRVGSNKERVSYNDYIGTWVSYTGSYYRTKNAMIHYSSTGAHIVPAAP